MLPADVSGDAADRTPADNQTVRNVFVIGPDKKIKLILVYPMTTGRNFDEVLRVIDSLQLTAKHKVATPAKWQQGDDVIIAGSVSNDEAKEIYPEGWEEPRPYIRIVPQPDEVEGLAEAVEQVAEDPRGRSPDQVALDLVGRGVDRDAAADQAAHRVALASTSSEKVRTVSTSVGFGSQVEPRGCGDQADEGVDPVAGDEGRGRRQGAAELDRGGVEADLLLGLAQGGRQQVGVARGPGARRGTRSRRRGGAGRRGAR